MPLRPLIAGDSNYQSGQRHDDRSPSQKLASSLTATPSASSIAANAVLTVTGTVSGVAGGPTPTGSVSLSGGSYTSSGVFVAANGSYSITVPASSLSVGSDTLTVQYSGDGNYTSSNAMASVAVTAPVAATYSITPATAAAISAPGGASSSAITVASSTGYAGTVTLTCALTSGPTNQSGDAPSCSAGSASISVNAQLIDHQRRSRSP